MVSVYRVRLAVVETYRQTKGENMTRKDYKAFAAEFRPLVIRSASEPSTEHHTMLLVVGRTADIFARDNPRFDRARFYTACGYEGYK